MTEATTHLYGLKVYEHTFHMHISLSSCCQWLHGSVDTDEDEVCQEGEDFHYSINYPETTSKVQSTNL